MGVGHDQCGCAWCGSKVKTEPQVKAQKDSWLCSECHDTFQVESARSLHPMEERHPYHD